MSDRYLSVGREWLLKLATHLEVGELGHKEFDFTTWNNSKRRNGTLCTFDTWLVLKPAGAKFNERNRCGTVGCAIGEMPFVAPDDWFFDEREGMPYYKDSMATKSWPLYSAQDFFGISNSEAGAMFIPTGNVGMKHGCPLLPSTASKEQVAANIRLFVAYKDKQLAVEV